MAPGDRTDPVPDDPVPDHYGAQEPVLQTRTPVDGVEATGSPAVQEPGLVRSSALVAAGTGLSRITGLLRVGALTYALGTTVLADAYNLANTTPNIIYELLLGGILSATLVPIFVESRARQDRDAVDALVTVSFVAMLVLTVAALVAAPWIVALYTSRLSPADAAHQAEVAVPLLRLFAPQILFYGGTTIGTALLHSHRSFAAPAFAPVLNNVMVSTMLLALPRVAAEPVSVQSVLDDRVLLLLLGLGTTAGIAAMTIVLWPAVRRTGTRLRWNWAPRHPAVRTVLSLSGWTLGYVAANQVALFVVLALANGAGDGAVSAYTYGFIFFQLPHGLIAVSLMTTLLPALAAAAAAHDDEDFAERFARGVRLLTVVMLPAAAGLVVLARPLVRGLLENGAFTGASSQLTGDVVIGLAIGLPAYSLYLLVLRGFYARKNTRTPFGLNVLQNGTNIVLAIVVVDRYGVAGLAVAYSVAYLVASIAAARSLGKQVAALLGGRELRTALRSAVATGVMAAALLALLEILEGDVPDLALLALAVPIGLVMYLVTAVLLRVDELRALRELLPARRPGS